MASNELDITKNIKMIEEMQCELLSLVSQLYCSMRDSNAQTKDRAEILANIQIIVYLLGKRLGISFQALDQKMVSKLKLGVLEESGDEWKSALLALLRHMDTADKG